MALPNTEMVSASARVVNDPAPTEIYQVQFANPAPGKEVVNSLGEPHDNFAEVSDMDEAMKDAVDISECFPADLVRVFRVPVLPSGEYGDAVCIAECLNGDFIPTLLTGLENASMTGAERRTQNATIAGAVLLVWLVIAAWSWRTDSAALHAPAPPVVSAGLAVGGKGVGR